MAGADGVMRSERAPIPDASETRAEGAGGEGAARRRRAFVVYGVATFFAFPHEIPFAARLGLPSVIDLGLVLAWVVPAALVVAIDDLSPKRAARLAGLASFATHVVFFYWFSVVTVVYGGMPLALGALAPIVPALWVAPFTALFAWAWRRLDASGAGAIALGGALWVVAEWLRGTLLGGFPWASLGYALHADWPLAGLTRWGGVHVLSFVAAGVGVAIAQVVLRRDPRARGRLVATALVVLALHGLGAALASGPRGETRAVRVAAIQGNVDQGEKWDQDRRETILARYLRLSEQAATEGVDWIVWPETAVPGLIENDRILRGRLEGLAERTGATLVVGGMGVEIDHAERRFSAFFDSAFLIEPGEGVRDRYDKTHLVPFGEFVPLRGLLGRFFQALASGLSSSDVTPGARPRNFDLASPEPADGRLRVGVPICYELLFPDLVRRFGGEGAGALLAITNDAWYGRTGAPHQFLAMTALRAAETGLPTVRAANTGISALIDERGRIRRRSGLFEEATVVGTIEVPLRPSPTVYARVGDVFVLACAIGGVGFAGLRRRARNRTGTPTDATVGVEDEGTGRR